MRYGLIAFGWVNVGLGMLGMFLPVMPTTVFLPIALWAFSRSSRRFHHWLFTHPTLGRTLRDWHSHRVIPLGVKILAVSVMTVSLSYVTLAEGWALPLLLGAVLGGVSAFILSRPAPPAASKPRPVDNSWFRDPFADRPWRAGSRRWPFQAFPSALAGRASYPWNRVSHRPSSVAGKPRIPGLKRK